MSEREKTMLAFGILSIAALCFETAYLLVNTPLAPSGPLTTVLDRGIDAVQSSPNGAPGISVAIVRDGAIAYTHVSGLADVGTNTAVTPNTRFRVGSITKIFTAVTIMQLVEAGRLKLDASVQAYLPDAPHASEITIRQLLSHTSGLPNVLDMALTTDVAQKPTAPSAMLDPLVRHALDFAPGSQFGYSNTNYVVLGQIIERLDARPLADVESEQIFEPAGMGQTSIAKPYPDASIATGYIDPAGTKLAPTYDPSWLYASADIVTTASDLARFDIALMGGKLITLKSLGEMERAISDTGDGSIDYGLGLMLYPFGARDVAGHHGEIPGYASDDEMITKDDYGVIVLANQTRFTTSRIDTLAFATAFPIDFIGTEARAIREKRAREPTASPVSPVPTSRPSDYASSKIVTPLPPSSALP